MNKKPSKKEQELHTKLDELTLDIQRQRADFENYRKRVEIEKEGLRELTKAATIMKLLPVIDNIERAITHVPKELADNTWAQGVVTLGKNLEKTLSDLGLSRIAATKGTPFDPNQHEAVMMDESEGDTEVVAEELRAGYKLNGNVIRPSMVRVERQ